MSAGGPGTIRVVLADDHTLFRQGIGELILTSPEFTVAAHAETGEEAVAAVLEHQPDILLLDVEMPGPGAAAVLDRVRQASPGTAVLVLTMYDLPGLVSHMLERGAAGYLVKNIRREELIAALHSAALRPDHVVLSLSRRTVDDLRHSAAAASLLTPRETEVLRLVALALTNVQIAARLGISEGTVKRHLTNLFAKLQATSRLDALRKAAEKSLLLDDGVTLRAVPVVPPAQPGGTR